MSKYAGNIVTTGADIGYSVYFDGSGDYLSIADNTALDMGASDFTIECYVYMTSTPGTTFLFGKRANNTIYGALVIQFSGNTTPILLATVNGSSWGVNITSTISTGLNTWAHIAVTRSGNTWTLWVNGVSGGTASLSGTVPDNASAFTIAAGSADGSNVMPSCYISNFRVVKGTALYTAAFTPPTQLLNIPNTSLLTCNAQTIADQSSNNFAITVNGDSKVSTFSPFAGYQAYNPALGAATPGVWSLTDALNAAATRQWNMYDPYFKNTTLLLHGTGGKQTNISDASVNNFAITPSGAVTPISSTRTPFASFTNSGSTYFNGSSDYVTAPANAAFAFGTGAWTVEAWVYITTLQEILLFDTRSSVSTAGVGCRIAPDGTLSYSGSANNTLTSTAVTANTWTHVAWSYDGTTLSGYINGNRGGTATPAFNITQNNAYIGRVGFAASGYMAGYVSNLRVIKGAALYSGASITVPTAPLTPVSGTSLLTLQYPNAANNNAFLDSSSNNFLITRNGNTTQGSFTPFSPSGWSNSFNGSSDFLTTSSTAFNFGTSPFTVEGWVYVNAISGRQAIYAYNNNSIGSGPVIAVDASLSVDLGNVGSSNVNSGANAFQVGQWFHFAVVREGTGTNQTKIYVNGVQRGVGTYSTSVTTTYTLSIGKTSSFSEYLNGYISNLRVVNGTAVYTSNFTPSTSPLTVVPNTVLLTCQSNRFVDNSANNFTLTPNGTPSVQAFSPFNSTVTTPVTYSWWFDGSGDYVTWPAVTVGAGVFTFECWFNSTNFGASQTLFGPNGTTNGGFGINVVNSTTIGIDRYGVSADNFTVPTMSTNTWYHIAVVRNASNVTTVFLNGVRSSTGTVTIAYTFGDVAAVGYTSSAVNRYFFGAISNARYVTSAIYDPTQTSITVPTVPFPTNTTNQQLLVCQARTFVDSNTATTAKTITSNGNVKPVDSPNPFGFGVDQSSINASYTTASDGGSAYFDGTGDYLTTPWNTALELAAGNFTIEFWVYPTGGNALYCWSTDWHYGMTWNYNGATNKIGVWASSNGTTWDIFNADPGGNGISTGLVVTNTWQHIALVRSGSAWTLYVNGAVAWTGTSSATIVTRNTDTFRVAGPWPNVGPANFAGYMAGFRIIKGTAVYTSAFTPPTAPPTPITNTSLLLNFTNAGIVDTTAKNVLETVGNAAISTTVSKFGGSSMYFDGTGDWLTSPANTNSVANYDFGTGDFTIECWIYLPTIPSNSYEHIVCFGVSGSAQRWSFYIETRTVASAPYLSFASFNSANSAVVSLNGGGSAGWATNTWTHVAVTRSGSTFKLFKDGVQNGSSTTSTASVPGTAATTSSYLTVGTELNLTSPTFSGYIQDIRITKGYARYTSNFTPPTSLLQNQ